MRIIAEVGTIVTHSEVAGLHPNTLLLGVIGETGVPTGVVRNARDVRAARPTVDPYMVVYVPPKPAPKVGDVIETREGLGDLPDGAVIVGAFGDAGRKNSDGYWDFAIDGRGGGAIYPAELVWLPEADA